MDSLLFFPTLNDLWRTDREEGGTGALESEPLELTVKTMNRVMDEIEMILARKAARGAPAPVGR